MSLGSEQFCSCFAGSFSTFSLFFTQTSFYYLLSCPIPFSSRKRRDSKRNGSSSGISLPSFVPQTPHADLP